ATAVRQVVENHAGGADGSATVNNFGGFIHAHASAYASSTAHNAFASAFAGGVVQEIFVGPDGHSGIARVFNSGQISGYATAKAVAAVTGTANAFADGVFQEITGVGPAILTDPASGIALAQVTNTGAIHAVAKAFVTESGNSEGDNF